MVDELCFGRASAVNEGMRLGTGPRGTEAFLIRGKLYKFVNFTNQFILFLDWIRSIRSIPVDYGEFSPFRRDSLQIRLGFRNKGMDFLFDKNLAD